MTSHARQPPSDSADAAMTVDEWIALGKEALELKCLFLHIDSIGDADVLAQRLFERFHSQPPALTEDREATVSPQPDPNEGKKAESQQSQSDEESSSNDDDDDDSDGDSPANRRTKKPADPTPEGNNTPEKDDGTNKSTSHQDLPDDPSFNLAETAFEATQTNGMLIKDLIDRVGHLGSGQELYLEEIRALRTQLA